MSFEEMVVRCYEKERRTLEGLRLATVARYPWINWPIIIRTTRTKDAPPGINCCVHCVHHGLCAEKRLLLMWELLGIQIPDTYESSDPLLTTARVGESTNPPAATADARRVGI